MADTEGNELLRCQNCHLPIQLDSSLLDLSLSQKNLIVTSIGDQDPTEALLHGEYFPKDRLNKLKGVITADTLNHLSSSSSSFNVDSKQEQSTGPANDGKLKTDASRSSGGGGKDGGQNVVNSGRTLATQISTLSNIFNILSSKSSIDYPVCQDCCELLIRRLRKEYDETLEEKELYIQFLEKLKRQHSVQNSRNYSEDTRNDLDNSCNKIDLEYGDALRERNSLLEKLKFLEDEEDSLDNQILLLRDKLKNQSLEDEYLMEEINLQELSQYEFQNELRILQNQYETCLNNLDLLRKTNIYNETFKISHNGPFGTINGLRLGSIHKTPVSWKEINAALGQVVLLLSLLTKQLNCPITNHRLEPLGSCSKILKYDAKNETWTTLEAYYDENFKFTKLFHSETNFDKSLVSLLDVIQQLAQHVLNTNNNKLSQVSQSLIRNTTTKQSNVNNTITDELPYPIFDGKINSLSVTLYGKEPDIKWTTAMKFLLTDLKWLLFLSINDLANASQ